MDLFRLALEQLGIKINITDDQLSALIRASYAEMVKRNDGAVGYESGSGKSEKQGVRFSVKPMLGNKNLTKGLRELEEGETCQIERIFTESKSFEFSSVNKVESYDDIAYIFKKLEDEAVENSFAVLVKRGKPTVIHLGMGNYTATMLNQSALNVAVNRVNPDKIYFVHNHPSGVLHASKEDVSVWQNLLKQYGSKLADGVIINTRSGWYGVFNDDSSYSAGKQEKSSDDVRPLKVYSFDKQVFAKDYVPQIQIFSSEDVASFISAHRLGDRQKLGLIITNNKEITGNIFLPYTEITKDNARSIANDISYYTSVMGGNRAFMFGNVPLKDIEDKGIGTLVNKLSGLHLLDYVEIDGGRYKSANDEGVRFSVKEEPELIDESRRGQENQPLFNKAVKDKIESLFNRAITGDLKGKPIAIGRLTNNGKLHLEHISGLSFKDNVDFVLNPSDLVHIYNNHFEDNEKDKGQDIPLVIEDIRNIVDVISSPDKIIFFKEAEGNRRNMFYFLKEAEVGAYNLMEIYSNRKGNLTAKTFYKSKKDASQRVMDIDKSLLPTSETYSGAILSDANIPQMFEITNISDQKLHDKDENTRFRVANENQEIFVSNAARAVEGIKQEKATPQQWKAMIQSKGGLKAGEDKWLGLSEWLDDKAKAAEANGSNKANVITKQEVLDFIGENKIRIEEVEYYEESQFFRNNTGYTDEGIPEYIYDEFEEVYNDLRDSEEHGNSYDLEDEAWNIYTESAPSWIRDAIQVRRYSDGTWDLEIVDREVLVNHITGDKRIANSTRLYYTTEGLENKREIALTVPTIKSWNEEDEIHFGDAGGGRAVAWARFGETTDSEGNSVLVVDEIQSKRHQEGREKGYISTPEDKRNYYNYKHDLENKYGSEDWPLAASDAEIDEYERLERIAFGNRFVGGVPDAPFDKNWHELTMKRMLRLAAEEGFDKVAWTKGEQQAERYNIGAVLQGLKAYKTHTNKYYVIPYNNGVIGEFVKEYTEQELADTFGKELAQNIITNAENATEETPYEIEGEDLRIGGEGMKGFYDDILPRFMNKYGKKWGVKVGEVELPELEEAGRTMWGVDVTPEMKESVMEGQVMFRFVRGMSNDDIHNALSGISEWSSGAYDVMSTLEEYYGGEIVHASRGARDAMKEERVPVPGPKYSGDNEEYHHFEFRRENGETFVEAVPFVVAENVEEKTGIRFLIRRRDNGTRFSISSDEKDRIRRETQADGTYMKAPNGRPTRLEESDWLVSKTEGFREWLRPLEERTDISYDRSIVWDSNGDVTRGVVHAYLNRPEMPEM